MALALDESKDDDQKYEVLGLTFIVNQQVVEMLKNYGTVQIDYKDYPWGGQIVVKAAGSSDCS